MAGYTVRIGDGSEIDLAGLDEVTIGDSLVDPEDPQPLKRIAVDEPTMAMPMA